MAGIEAELHRVELEQAPEEQRRAGQERRRQADLGDDQDAPEPGVNRAQPDRIGARPPGPPGRCGAREPPRRADR